MVMLMWIAWGIFIGAMGRLGGDASEIDEDGWREGRNGGGDELVS